MNIGDTVYRYERDHFCQKIPKSILREFKVIKITPRGGWIKDYGRSRFILNGGKAKFAYPTKELAWHNFGARTKRHVQILKSQLAYAMDTLITAQSEPPKQ
jgi:hypothetical protein